jgi:uroporphyrin-III C-methyltransferase / precorrin-2 dehydrogenase / sirohydrochlorin ferrochelatase
MRYLPVFLDLHSGPVLLVGSGELARAKLRVLVAAGARIRWHAISGEHDVHGLEPAQLARIELAKSDPLQVELKGVVAVFCAGAGDIGVAMAARAKSVGLPVNVMDDLAHSTFIFPAIVDRGDVVVAIGTGGTSPVVARRVREKIEAVLPARIGDLAKFIGRYRKAIHERIAEMPLRRRFWERVIDGPIGALVLSGHKAEAEAALNEIADPNAFAGALASGEAPGSVTFLGAGPGDADLLTVKALRVLQDADTVFHDQSVSTEILDRIRRDAARVTVSDENHDARRLMIQAAQAGHRVVRLGAGDGFAIINGEEFAALREAGFACFAVPGVSADLGEDRPVSLSAVRARGVRADAANSPIL